MQQTRHSWMAKIGAGLALLAGSMLAVTACGSSTSPPTGSSAVASTPTTSSSTTQTAQAPSGSGPSTRKDGGPPSSSAASGADQKVARRRRSHVHLVLPSANSKPAPKLTPAQQARLTVADISLSGAGITQHVGSTGTIARQYTCAGANSSPPLRWSGVPAGTKEMVLFAMSLVPVSNKLFFDWAVAGLNPGSGGIPASQLPPGAIVGRNSYGQTAYSICPPGGKRESYVFAVYALPQHLSIAPGFDPATVREQAKQVARHAGLLVGSYG